MVGSPNFNKTKRGSSPERFELSRGNPMYLAGTRLNHSAKATVDSIIFSIKFSLLVYSFHNRHSLSSVQSLLHNL